MTTRKRKASPIPFREQEIIDRMLRDSVRELKKDLPRYPRLAVSEFENALAERAHPWRPLVVLLWAARAEGQTREQLHAIGDAFHRLADAITDPDPSDGALCPVQVLVDEADVGSTADQAQTRALAVRTADACDDAALATARHVKVARHTQHVLTHHAFKLRTGRMAA